MLVNLLGSVYAYVMYVNYSWHSKQLLPEHLLWDHLCRHLAGKTWHTSLASCCIVGRRIARACLCSWSNSALKNYWMRQPGTATLAGCTCKQLVTTPRTKYNWEQKQGWQLSERHFRVAWVMRLLQVCSAAQHICRQLC